MEEYQHQYDFPVEEAVGKRHTLTKNDGVLLEQEFKALRRMDTNRITIATNPINKSKNRYASVYPYDEDFCRVRLKTDSEEASNQSSDYINASIVRCIRPEHISKTITSRIFLAAQGPTEHTLDDFVRMIFEQEIFVIVMLSYTYDPITCTYAEEHAAYFSDKVNSVIETEHFRIRTTLIIPAYRYVGRRLRIKSKLTKKTHECEQFHYPHFIDKGIPPDCHSMIGLVMRLRELCNRQRSMLVHCSAGIGRTGVFIALYYLISDFDKRRMLNVKQLVDTIRIYRPHLVQTVEQYEYIYRCLAEVAIHPCDGRPVDAFIEYFKKSFSQGQLRNDDIHSDYMNRNNSIQPHAYFSITAAQQYSSYNRDEHFVPYDQNRVILYSPSESMYLNASTLPNMSTPKGTILTQEPTKSTLQPFFAMLLQEHKKMVVVAEQMQPSNYTASAFVGSEQIQANILQAKPSKHECVNYHRLYRMQVNQGLVRQSEIFIFEFTGEWTDDGKCIPKNLEHFVRFIDRSICYQKKIDPNRLGLVVHDRIGGTKAAFYCIAQNILDRLLIDGRVSIENFVTHVCQQRMNALIALEQYIALHEIVCIWNTLKKRGALTCTPNSERV
ncbi:unnamed protein product [Adineta ricciae]|uniref:Uncharacterized protein n=1 Tax=Adineta ricciae TaxID=249248 RepID=A0A813U7F7_ADIRI|nr:unnamed protein product [Adineta ricciae]